MRWLQLTVAAASAALLASAAPAPAGYLTTFELVELERPLAGRPAEMIATGVLGTLYPAAGLPIEVALAGDTVLLTFDSYDFFPMSYDTSYGYSFELPPLSAGEHPVILQTRIFPDTDARTVIVGSVTVDPAMTVAVERQADGRHVVRGNSESSAFTVLFGQPVVDDETIRVPVQFEPCPFVCPPAPQPVSESFGPLAAGSYQLELVDDSAVYPRSGIVLREQIEVLDADALVRGGRFRIEVLLDPPHQERARLVKPPSADSALFYFFSPDNWEIMVKVLAGCGLNGHYWVYGAASTDVGYTVRVTDQTGDGGVKEYRHSAGTPAPALTDGAAFPCE
jgi:hypothetical protein